MAQLVGVRANWVISSAFAITGLMAGVVALLYVFRTGAVTPNMGQGPLLIAFVGCVIGGIGSMAGAALGGFVLGALINALQATLPTSVNSHTQLFAFLVVIAILVLLPDGLVTLPRRVQAWRRSRRPSLAGETSESGVCMTGLRHRLEGPAQKAWPPLFLAAVVVVTWILVDRFGDVVYETTAGRMLLMLIIVLGLQMFSGNSGVLSFGHITFVAIGAYSSALLTIPTEIKEFSFLTMPHWLSYWIFPAELSPLEGTLAGGGFAALFALIVAPAIVRLRGVQAGIATLALLVIANVFIVQTTSITRGTSTQIGVPTIDDAVLADGVGADLHRARLRVSAVAFRPPVEGVARERTCGSLGRRQGPARAHVRMGAVGLRLRRCRRALRSLLRRHLQLPRLLLQHERAGHRPAADRNARGGRHEQRHRSRRRLLPDHDRLRDLPALGGQRPRRATSRRPGRRTSCSRSCCSSRLRCAPRASPEAERSPGPATGTSTGWGGGAASSRADLRPSAAGSIE